MCGEKFNVLYYYGYNKGSPPHVRGKGKNANRRERAAGITPACAGKRKPARAGKFHD